MLNIAKSRGLSLVELMIGVAVIGLLATVIIPSYQNYIYEAEVNKTQRDIIAISFKISNYIESRGAPPASLTAAGVFGFSDPWDNQYVYYNVQDNGIGGARKDKNLNPINSDFDLYSLGKDGRTAKPLTPPQSHDDIIRANNGGFIGLALDY